MADTLARFVATGLVNTAVGLGLIILARELLGFSDLAANAIGYAGGLTVSFILNRNWTFRHVGAVAPALTRFLVVFAVAYSANLVVLGTLAPAPGLLRYAPHIAGMAVYTVVFYLGSRYLAFRT